MSPMLRAPDGRPFAFGDVPEDAFPIVLTAFLHGEVIWHRVIQPYEVVDIPPPPSEEAAGHIAMHVLYGNGVEYAYGPISMETARAYIREQLGE